MAVSLNSVVSFDLSAKCFLVSRSGNGPSSLSAARFSSPSEIFSLRRSIKHRSRGSCLLVADGDRVVTDTAEIGSGKADSESQPSSSTESEPPTQPKQDPSPANSKPGVKRSSLTAREKLRAARVLSRNTESKPSRSQLGSRLLDALKESDRGKKKSRLPEAPTNMLDDSKRGMPKKGLTFDFPGGRDVLIIAVSFVTISTIMFATTYFVWKVGAIHFNEN